MLWLALALAYAGLTALALGMKRHHQSLLGAKPVPRRLNTFRVVGCTLLGLMVLCCLSLWPLGLALSLAFGLATLAGLPLIFLLPYRPRLAARLAVALPLAAGIGVWVV